MHPVCPPMKLVFWQNMLAFHQSAHVRALAEQGHDVTFVSQETISDERKTMGWAVPDFGQAQVVIAPNHVRIRQLVVESPEDTIHVIGGIRGYQIGRKALAYCLATPRRVGFLSESPDVRSWKGTVRRLLYTQERIRYRQRIDFVLAMGQLGVRWFRQCGYPPSRVFPYAYLTERPSAVGGASGDSDTLESPVELLLVGQCIPRKGGDIALHALSRVQHSNWRLTIIGDGPSRKDLEILAARLGMSERVRFLSFLPNQEALQIMASSDLLVLPSRFDGWGAVVNEALMSGVPVICSDQCGASDLLRSSWRGEVFESASVTRLSGLLKKWITKGKRSPATTDRIKTWSRCIEGDSAAKYLSSVLRHVYEQTPLPEPPWYDEV